MSFSCFIKSVSILVALTLSVCHIASCQSNIKSNPIRSLTSRGPLGVIRNKLYGPVFNEPVSLAGKDIVITGGNTGLGKESAINLAKLGARVTILSRPSKKSDEAIEEIKKRSKNESVNFIPIDLASLSSIRECADQIKSKLSKVDVLINNAGVMALPERKVTKNGFEMQMGVNHLGHFVLTNELFSMLKKSSNGRIINVASSAHLFSKLQRDDFMLGKPGAYQPWIAYGNSKLANILFTQKLASQLKLANSSVMAFSCHPGVCRTELWRYFPNLPQSLVESPISPIAVLTKSPFQGSQTQTFLAASQRLSTTESGKYFENSRPKRPGFPSLPGRSPVDFSDADWLWALSEKFTGKPFSVY